LSRKKPIPFDVFIIQAYDEGYSLQVNKMRPRNAPSFKHTKADARRIRQTAKENMRLAEESIKRPMQSIDEVVARIKSYGGVE
jgi:hypothetical protein